MRIFLTLILVLFIQASYASSIVFSDLRISNAAHTKGLIIVSLDISRKQLEKAGINQQWSYHIYDDNGRIEQLYLSYAPNKSKLKDRSSGMKNSRRNMFRLFGLVNTRGKSRLGFYPINIDNGEKPKAVAYIDINTVKTVNSSSALLSGWAKARQRRFRQFSKFEASSIYAEQLINASNSAYNNESTKERSSRSRRMRNRRNTDLLSLLSADSAIEETLQTQLLRVSGKDDKLVGSIDKLKGVEIKALPYKKLLTKRKSHSLPIARLVPKDRYFVHMNRPGDVIQQLDEFSNVGLDISQLSGSNRAIYGLVDKYLARLQLTRQLVKQLAKAGSVKQLAFFGPDLYLDHGSDVSVILDGAKLAAVKKLLSHLLTAEKSKSFKIYRFGSVSKTSQTYYASHGHWMIFSSNKAELIRSLKLAKRRGRDSLGSSAEFRYMSSLLKRRVDQKQIYIYFSDPFIRRMVSPRVKIAQLRRAKARTQLKALTQASLLYKIDYKKWPTVADLLGKKFVNQKTVQGNDDKFTLNAGVAESQRYGSLNFMTPINQIPINEIYASEQKAYQAYLENYNRYWQQFFDPIGIMVSLNDKIEIETFILPLINNSIYQSLREAIGGPPVQINTPQFHPKPITQLSIKINKKRFNDMQKIIDRWVKKILRSRDLKSEDLFADNIHVAIYDNNPIISFGSEQILGGFSQNLFSLGRSDKFFTIGLILSSLTQPVSIFVKLKNAKKLRHALNRVRPAGRRVNRLSRMSLSRMGYNNDRGWMLTYHLFRGIKLNFHLRIVDDYLVVSNRELDLKKIASKQTDYLSNAVLQMNFSELKQMQAPLFYNAYENHANAFSQGAGRLYPMFLAGNNNVEQANSMHQRLYGFHPAGLDSDEWSWQPETFQLRSQYFGGSFYRRIPSYFDLRDKIRTTPFDFLQDMKLSFRFEQEGVRVRMLATPKTDIVKTARPVQK